MTASQMVSGCPSPFALDDLHLHLGDGGITHFLDVNVVHASSAFSSADVRKLARPLELPTW